MWWVYEYQWLRGAVAEFPTHTTRYTALPAIMGASVMAVTSSVLVDGLLRHPRRVMLGLQLLGTSTTVMCYLTMGQYWLVPLGGRWGPPGSIRDALAGLPAGAPMIAVVLACASVGVLRRDAIAGLVDFDGANSSTT